MLKLLECLWDFWVFFQNLCGQTQHTRVSRSRCSDSSQRWMRSWVEVTTLCRPVSSVMSLWSCFVHWCAVLEAIPKLFPRSWKHEVVPDVLVCWSISLKETADTQPHTKIPPTPNLKPGTCSQISTVLMATVKLIFTHRIARWRSSSGGRAGHTVIGGWGFESCLPWVHKHLKP